MMQEDSQREEATGSIVSSLSLFPKDKEALQKFEVRDDAEEQELCKSEIQKEGLNVNYEINKRMKWDP